MNYDFSLETKSIWRFEDRGNYGAHRGDYPGNWSPYVPRNIILRYTKEGDLVLDQFSGSGTTLIEAKNLNRNGIGCDVNSKALEIAKKRLDVTIGEGAIELIQEDARELKSIKGNSVKLICTHPPYSNIIKYSNDNNKDISLLPLEDFLKAMEGVADESYRVLEDNGVCAIMMGDIRKKGYVIPLGFNVLNVFLSKKFILKEIIIKEQFNCSSTNYWREISLKRNFLLLAHEYIFVFYKGRV